MADTLEILKGLAVQVRNATQENENTAEKVGRIFVGILNLMEDSGISFEVASGDDTLDVLKGLAGQIRNATQENENTAERIGRIFIGILNLLEHADKFEIVAGSDSVETLKELAVQVRNATQEGENTAERIGRIFVGILNLTVQSEEVPTEFLIRSDLPGMYYSSTQDALNAVRATYPDGLTKDITITCVKPAREKRGSDLYVSRLRDWNKGTVYTLTLDGADKLVYDCNSFGGLEFTDVNNVVIKNIDFVNASTYIAGNAAEELAAVAFIGNVESRAENFYAWNCRINTSGNNTARYGFITKFTRNIYLVGNTIKNSNCYSLKMLDCDFLSLVRNTFECNASYGLIGHPALCYITNSYGLVAEDNKFTGSTGEYLFNLTNVARAYFRRNSWIDCGGEAIRTSSQQGMKTLTLESNLFNGVLTNPSTSWTTSNIIIDCNVDEVSLINNTGVINGKPWQQWFLKQADTHSIDTLNVFNNVISDFTDESVATRGMVFGKVRKINSGNNLYRLKLKSGETDVVRNTIFSAVGLSGTDSISRLQSQGLETGSVLVGTDVPIFQPGSSKLLATLEYYADARYLPSADVEYKHPADTNNTIGCYNLAGIPIDETQDEVLGYTGRDFTENQGFTSAARYSTYAENILMFMSDTLVRERFVHMLAKGTHYQNLLLGRYGLLQLMPKVDANGEYQENEFYTVEIE